MEALPLFNCIHVSETNCLELFRRYAVEKGWRKLSGDTIVFRPSTDLKIWKK